MLISLREKLETTRPVGTSCAYQGKVGKVLRVVEHMGLPTTVLVAFTDGQMYYCQLKDLEQPSDESA